MTSTAIRLDYGQSPRAINTLVLRAAVGQGMSPPNYQLVPNSDSDIRPLPKKTRSSVFTRKLLAFLLALSLVALALYSYGQWSAPASTPAAESNDSEEPEKQIPSTNEPDADEKMPHGKYSVG